MSENKNNEIEEKKKRKKKNIAILVLMFLLLLCLFIVQCHLDRIKQEALRRQQETELEARQRYILDSLRRAEQMRADSLAALEQARLADSLRIADSLRLADSLRIADSLAALNPKLNQDSLRHVRDSIRHVRDSLAALEKARNDSLKHIADSLAALDKARADSLEKKRIQDSIRAADQIPPNAEITPPAGRYYDPIKLKVKCDEIKCKTFLSIGDTLNPVEAGKAIDYNKTGSVYYYAEDSVGNKSPWEEAKYDMASDNICGKNAYPVPVGGKTVCVDAYEYPNTPDENPRDAGRLSRQGQHQVHLRQLLQAEQVQHQHQGRQAQRAQGTVPKLVGNVRHERKPVGVDLYPQQGTFQHVLRGRWCLEHQQRKPVHREEVQLLPPEPVPQRRVQVL